MVEEQVLSKSEKTKRYIIEKAAPIFNQKGYVGTSLSDIIEATGLTKGGIYGNFKNKDEIALAAFDYNVKALYGLFIQTIKKEKDAATKLYAVLGLHKTIMYHHSLSGGCPILNTSIEVDDTHPKLKMKVIEALDDWRGAIIRIIKKGQDKGQIKPEIKAEKYANIFMALIEGAMMMVKAYQKGSYLKEAYERITVVIDNELKI